MHVQAALLSLSLLFIVLTAWPRFCSADQAGALQITVDCADPLGPLAVDGLRGAMAVHHWGEGHPARKAWLEGGFRHIRGYYLEPVVEVRPGAGAMPSVHVDFTNVDSQLAYIQSLGIEPVFLFGTTPRGLSSKPDSTEWPEDHFSQYAPADYSLWEQYVEKVVEHLVTKWGQAGAYYEVWNEPECYEEYWRGVPGSTDTMADYVPMYVHTARAIKAADPTAHVGGPASPHWKGKELGAPWGLEGFMRLLRQYQLDHPDETIPMDFISWHDYAWVSSRMLDGADHVDAILADIGWPDRPEYLITEWTLSPWGPGKRELTAHHFASHAAYNLITIAGERPLRITRLYYYLFDVAVEGSIGMVAGPNIFAKEESQAPPTWDLCPPYAVYQMFRQLDGGEALSVTAAEPVVALAARHGDVLFVMANNNSAEGLDVRVQIRGASATGFAQTALLQRVDEEHSSDKRGLEDGVSVDLAMEDGEASLPLHMPSCSTVLLTVKAE